MRLLILQSRNGTNGEDEIHGHEQNQHNVGSREWTKIELIEGFWLTKQNSQPPFFTTHPESILIFEQEKRDSRGGLTTPDSRIRLSQERLCARKRPNRTISRVGETDLRAWDIDFEGFGPSNRTILGKRQPLFFTPREKLTPNLTIFVALARLEYVFGP